MRTVYPLLIAAMLSLAVHGTVAQAEILTDIYTAFLPAEARGEAALRAARRRGLEQVLVKASGDATAAQRAATRSALDDAERYLLRYSYVKAPDGSTQLRLDYDEREVQALLRSADLPLWTANRPPVLAWLVISEGGSRHFLSPETEAESVAELRKGFSRRGVPLQLPLYDLEDTAALSPGEAWRQSSGALIDASRRYRDSEVLAGRAARTASGRWVGDWQLLYEGRWVKRQASGASFADIAEAGADLVASAIAGRYAVSLTDNTDLRHRVTLRGVRAYDDLVAAQGVLEGLEAVRRVVPERLVGDQVSLRIEADADLVQLARIIELDQRFVPTPAPSGDAGLFYEWIR
ncbi:MAG: DUF2066 domain-containing protein [Pseudomonadota bacterium]